MYFERFAACVFKIGKVLLEDVKERDFLKYVEDRTRLLAGCEFFKLLIYSWRIDRIRIGIKCNANLISKSLEQLVFL